MRNFFLILFVAVSSILPAQKKDLTQQYLEKYPEENAVYLKRTEYNTIKLEKGELKVYTKSSEDLLLLSDKVSSYSDRPIYFSSFSEISNVKAQSLNPNATGGYTIVPVKEKYVTNEFSEGSFYDDMRATHNVYTGLTTGSRIQMDYTEKLNQARFFGRFYFSTSLPTEDAEFSVEVPKGVTIDWKLFNINESDLVFTKTESKKKTIYTWKKAYAAKYKTEDDAPSSLYFAPHIVVYIKDYTVKGKTIKLLDGPGGLYDWYYSMVKGVNTTPDPAMQKIVDSLTNGITDEKEKVKKIFYWVQDNIKYVAFEDGLGGFVPREAQTICSRRYGDCKDMASITTTMLHLAGIPAYLTWIGSRGIPYRYTEVPSPLVDNHMICTYISDGKYYFLDATGRNTPFGTPSSFIQGKQALIGKGEGNFEIVTVPIIDGYKNLRTDSVLMKFGDDNKIYGTGVFSVTGYQKIHLTYPLDGVTDVECKTFFKKFLKKGNNKFIIDTLDYAHLYDRDINLRVNYQYSIGDYVRRNGDEMYVNMNLDKSHENQILDSSLRSAPMEIDFKNNETDITTLEIPLGYTSSCLPPDRKYDGEDFGFEISYRVENNRVICSKKIWINTLMVTPEQFSKWNDFIRQLTIAYSDNITLKKVPTITTDKKVKVLKVPAKVIPVLPAGKE
jgi:transglutaminase-like putative cysteine protease